MDKLVSFIYVNKINKQNTQYFYIKSGNIKPYGHAMPS